MNLNLWILVFCGGIIAIVNSSILHNFTTVREKIIGYEEQLRLGGKLLKKLSIKEKKVNQLFVKVREEELKAGLLNGSGFAPGMHFFKAKPIIEQSPVYKFINKMPKGALLHGHNLAMVSSEWVLKNLTYRKGLNMCVTKDDNRMLTFRMFDARCQSEPVSVAKSRANSRNVLKFDADLERTFNLYTPSPEVDYPDTNSVWAKFHGMFRTVSDMILYEPVFRDYQKQLLEELYKDGIQYAEIRSSFGNLYAENGRIIDALETAQILLDIVNEFKATHSDFLDVKIIYSTQRKTTVEKMKKKLGIFNKLHKQFPKFVIGFDMVGQEDLGMPISMFFELLQDFPSDAKFFFHAGETNWYGSDIDENLVDAILLKTRRIGHGYALFKHPLLWDGVKKLNIAIEVTPISNQVLGLVHDLRNHPASFYVSEDMPIVISCDDPGFWNAKGTSYDFYYAAMAFAPYGAGVEFLKQLVFNSIQHSVLDNREKAILLRLFTDKWNKFLDEVIAGNII